LAETGYQPSDVQAGADDQDEAPASGSSVVLLHEGGGVDLAKLERLDLVGPETHIPTEPHASDLALASEAQDMCGWHLPTLADLVRSQKLLAGHERPPPVEGEEQAMSGALRGRPPAPGASPTPPLREPLNPERVTGDANDARNANFSLTRA
jgi:hypothetical protein